MRIYITDKNEVRNIVLRVWDNQANNGWGPDVFGDLAYTIPCDFPATGYDTDAEAAMTEQDYHDTVTWWEQEIELYNNRAEHNWFVEALSDDERETEYAKDLEYGLDAD